MTYAEKYPDAIEVTCHTDKTWWLVDPKTLDALTCSQYKPYPNEPSGPWRQMDYHQWSKRHVDLLFERHSPRPTPQIIAA